MERLRPLHAKHEDSPRQKGGGLAIYAVVLICTGPGPCLGGLCCGEIWAFSEEHDCERGRMNHRMRRGNMKYSHYFVGSYLGRSMQLHVVEGGNKIASPVEEVESLVSPASAYSRALCVILWINLPTFWPFSLREGLGRRRVRIHMRLPVWNQEARTGGSPEGVTLAHSPHTFFQWL